jgi:hypothetical protein
MRVDEILTHGEEVNINYLLFSILFRVPVRSSGFTSDIGQPTSDSRRIFYFSRGKKNLRSFFDFFSIIVHGFSSVFRF